MMRSPCVNLALLAATLASCAHEQSEGKYAFTAEEVLSDDCGLLDPTAELWAGTVTIRGDAVSMEYELFGMLLRGKFEEVEERFYVDGTASNVTAGVGGEECRIDLAQVHLEAATKSTTAFTGVIQVRYESSRERCQCTLSVRYRAELVVPARP